MGLSHLSPLLFFGKEAKKLLQTGAILELFE